MATLKSRDTDGAAAALARSVRAPNGTRLTRAHGRRSAGEVLFLAECGTITSGDDYEGTVDCGRSFLRGFAQHPPALAGLAADIGLGGFPLGIERGEGRVEIMLGRFAV
jgi:hypothetical protein